MSKLNMITKKNLANYLNPIARLGLKEYSLLFPFITTVISYILLEVVAFTVLQDPEAIGIFAIFFSLVFIIYFSFRDGLLGGITTTLTTIFYYLYIVYSRNYQGDRLTTSLETIIVLAIIYLILAGVIGWLKQTIDDLILREADEKRRLQTIIQQLPVGVLVTNNQGVIEQVNKKVSEILGVQIPIGHHIGSGLLVKASFDNKPAKINDSPILKTLETGRAVTNKEYIIEKKDGDRQTFVQVSTQAIKNRESKVIAVAEIINDITHQKQIESLKDEFIGIVSHELKTPLTSIKGYTQILEQTIKDLNNQKATEYLQRTNKYIDKLSILISDLLDISRIQAGKFEFNNEEYDFDQMVSEVINSFQPLSNKIKIIKKGSTGKKIFGDSARTEQVLINLLSNAIKYSPDTDKVIVTTQSNKDHVILSVKDYGIGISKENQKHLFKKFFRVEGTELKFSGLGIGLYISSEIISRQGGKIWVESEVDKGSTFYFSLPIKNKKSIKLKSS